MVEVTRRRSLVLFEIGAAALLLLLAFGVAAKGVLNMHRYPSQPVVAAAFEAPTGCAYAGTKPVARVPAACVSPAYRLTKLTDLGLGTVKGDEHWYRVGDDALLLLCFDGGDACAVRGRVSGKFVRAQGDQA
ncbi:hypothetical protein [Sphingomonas sp. Leaf10]|uniref:hypothetical protein n=1 Tax=Sphingomonas sp. Leaf10 TaxID=1735676 RepID=UPI0006F68FBF|nr:hypothetical protein [Sphingomonas sp. Leaf10]KQM41205.1 hypothetical protein ASE59_02680 [Sphingomonas sp. Leaf10]